MKVVIAGGAGQVGTIVARAFHGAGHQVVVLSRRPTAAPWRTVMWDGRSVGAWAAELEGADAVINMAGHNVNCRYTAKNRRLILESRVDSTQAVARAINGAIRPPRVWLQGGTATIYAHRYDAANDEARGIIGGNEAGAPDSWRFSIHVAKSWEEAVKGVSLPRTRKVILRSGMVMSPDRGGVFDILSGMVRRGLGGRAGDGRQFLSWIHERDFVRAIFWLIEHEEISGAVNATSPHPVSNDEFMRELRKGWGIRFGLNASKWMMEVAALFLGTETELILKSRYVVPGRLLAGGFSFEFAKWGAAVRDLCGRAIRRARS